MNNISQLPTEDILCNAYHDIYLPKNISKLEENFANLANSIIEYNAAIKDAQMSESG